MDNSVRATEIANMFFTQSAVIVEDHTQQKSVLSNIEEEIASINLVHI